MDNIEVKSQELIDTIVNSDAYVKYIEAKKLLEESTYLQELMDNIRNIQKEIVKAEKKENMELYNQKQEELARCNNELEEILYMQIIKIGQMK